LGVGAPKDVSASFPLYLERSVTDSVTDTYAPQGMQAYTTTNTAPNGLPPGFVSAIYNRQTGEVFERVAQPFLPSSTNALVATIHKPANTTTTTATPFQTVSYTTATPQPPSPKKVVQQPPRVDAIAPSGSIEVADNLEAIAEKIGHLAEKKEIKYLLDTYQSEGIKGLMNRKSITQVGKLAFNPQVRADVRELVMAFNDPEIIAAIKDPNTVFGDQEQMDRLRAIFDNDEFQAFLSKLGLSPSEKSTSLVKKKTVVKAEASSDLDEEPTPAEAAGDDVPLDKLIAELSEAEDPHAGHAHAKQSKPTVKRHIHEKRATAEK
jgi:hypothetical protein